MFNLKPVSTFKSFGAIPNTVLPDYDKYNFRNIIPTINYLLSSKCTGTILPKDCFTPGSYPASNKVVFCL
jgi:hypothetical protein